MSVHEAISIIEKQVDCLSNRHSRIGCKKLDSNTQLHFSRRMENKKEFVFNNKSIKLSCYFYACTSEIPTVKWNDGYYPQLLTRILTNISLVDCNQSEIYQCNVKNCYFSEMEILLINSTTEFTCNVTLSGVSNESIQFSYTVFYDLLDKFSNNYKDDIYKDDQYIKDFPENDAPPFKLLEDFSDFVNANDTVYNEVEHNTSYSLVNSNTELELVQNLNSTTKAKKLDYFSLTYMEESKFKFHILESVACESESVTLVCELFHLVNRPIEIWHIGLNFQNKLLKTADSEVVRIKSAKNNRTVEEYLNFANFVRLQLVNLSVKDEGQYICKIAQFFQNLTINVTQCNKSNNISFILIGTSIIIIILIFVFCLHMLLKRHGKNSINLFSVPTYSNGDHKPRCKQVHIVKHCSLLYPTLINPKYQRHCSNASSQCRVTTANSSRIFRLPQPNDFNWFGKFDMWTIRSDLVSLNEVIGQGTFGIVFSGYLADKLDTLPVKVRLAVVAQKLHCFKPIPVAVKTTKDKFNLEQWKNLVKEVEIMSSINPHPNIIPFFGLTVERNNIPLILFEWATRGNLRDYLRLSRPQNVNFVGSCDEPITRTSNLTYSIDHDPYIGKEFIKELLIYACHIVNAMCYIESIGLIHRDVACRNVLLTENFVAKLGDFGSACTVEDVSNSTDHRTVNCDRKICEELLPYRWMAPESLCASPTYSHKTDVWSFGIFLWELFTLGHTPYPGLENSTVATWLSKGHRNSRPYLASSQMFKFMLHCWHSDPQQRPNFTQLYTNLTNYRLHHAKTSTLHPKVDYVKLTQIPSSSLSSSLSSQSSEATCGPCTTDQGTLSNGEQLCLASSQELSSFTSSFDEKKSYLLPKHSNDAKPRLGLDSLFTDYLEPRTIAHNDDNDDDSDGGNHDEWWLGDASSKWPSNCYDKKHVHLENGLTNCSSLPTFRYTEMNSDGYLMPRNTINPFQQSRDTSTLR